MNSTRIVSRTPRIKAAALLAAILLCGGVAPAQAVPVFSLAPSATTVQGGQAFTVNVMAANVVDLFAYQFNVSFDPSLYRVTSVSEGPLLSAGGSTFYSPGTIDNTTGSVSFVFDTIIGSGFGVNGSGLLGTVSLSALSSAAGSGSIGLTDVSAFNSTLDTIALAPVTSAVVAVVPEPGAWAMLSVGLVCLLGLRRQRMTSARQA